MIVTPDVQKMRGAWGVTVRPFGPTAGEAGRVFGVLAACHSEPARHYHTLAHVAALWDTLEDLRGRVAVQGLTAIRLALWFHDAVYDAKAADNEARSAALALTLLPGLAVPAATLAPVERLILATKAHRAAPDDTDCQALLDCDLAVLGAPQTEYDAYARAIRREYDWVPDADYRAGRSKVLAAFLQREAIYFTPPMRDRLETTARENLRRESNTL